MNTGLSGIAHADNPAIDEATAWLAAQPIALRPVLPELRKRFGLTALEGCEACARVVALRRGEAGDGCSEG